MDELIEGLNGGRLTNSMTVVAASLLAADYMHTFPLEVDLIWPHGWNGVKVVYFLARYTAPFPVIFSFIHAFRDTLTAEGCRAIFTSIPFASVVNAAPSEALLYWRVYAFSGRNKWIGGFLLFQFITKFTTVIVLLVKYFSSIQHIVVDGIPGLHCVPLIPDKTLISVAFAVPMIPETCLLVIMIWTAYVRYPNLKSAILTIFMRDGVIYLLGISILSVINVAISFGARDSLRYLFSMVQAVALPILATRMTLFLRRASEREMAGVKRSDIALTPVHGGLSAGDSKHSHGQTRYDTNTVETGAYELDIPTFATSQTSITESRV